MNCPNNRGHLIDAHGEARFLNLDKLDEGEEPRIPVRDLLGYRFGKGDAVIWAFTESAWKETLGGVADLRDPDLASTNI
jgi:hypothetical protein